MAAVRGRTLGTMGGFLTPYMVSGTLALAPVVILSVQGRDDTTIGIQGRNDVDPITVQGRDSTLIAVEGRSD